MSFVKFLLVSISIVGANWAQESVLVEVKFKIREERVPPIIFDVLNSSLEEHNVTTRDIIKLSKLDRYDLEDVAGVYEYFNRSVEAAFTVDGLKDLLTSVNVSFQTFYSELISNRHLNLTNGQIQNIINALRISLAGIFMAISAGDEQQIYAELKKGTYDREHVSAALDAAGKSGNEVYTAARDVVLARVLKLEAADFMQILRNSGWDQVTAINLYNALNLTARDVCEVEKFGIVLTNISDSVNGATILGVFVGYRALAVHEVAYEGNISTVDGVTFKADADGVEISLNKSRNLGKRIVELLASEERDGFIEVVGTYSSNATSDECYYLTANNTAWTVEVDFEQLSIEKPDSAEFSLGSPLVCDGFLYGLAAEENSTTIFFDRFYTESESYHTTTESPSSCPALLISSNILISSLLLHLFTF